MTTSNAKPRKNRAPLNLTMGWVGLVAVTGLVATSAFEAGIAARAIVVVALLVSLATMFATRKSDEYTLGLWSSGANAAFAVIILWFLFAPFLEGVYDGFMQAHEGAEAVQDFPTEGGSIAGIFAFFVVFNIKRLTGAM